MFKFLKDKLKNAVSAFTKKVDAEAKPVEQAKAEKPKEKSATQRPLPKPTKGTPVRKTKKSAPEQIPPEVERPEELLQETPELETEDSEPEQREVAGNQPGQETETLEPEAEIDEIVSEEPEIQESITAAQPESAPQPEKKSFWDRFKKKETVEQPKLRTAEQPEERKGFFGRMSDAVTKTAISESKFEDLFQELEIALLESNVAFEVVEKIKADLKRELVEQKVLRGSVEETIQRTLRQSIDELFLDPIDVVERIRAKAEKPFVLAFVGVNGSGKTTTIAKFAHLLQQHKLRPVIAAADTFRAAAIQQLEEHANKLGVKLIKQDYGADPAAVGFDAIAHAKAHAMDVVLIDTAGRQHANTNLMEEMKKIIRVCKPDMTIFIGESITGNDCVEQAREFGDAVHLDGIILTKADVDEKGGAFVSVSYITGKPILYVGLGQGYGDLKPFDKQLVLENLGIA